MATRSSSTSIADPGRIAVDDSAIALDRTAETSSGVVRWARLGPETAPVVVLNHGTPFSSRVWHPVAGHLAERWQVVVWDMPGFGASSKHDGQDVSLAAQGRVFAELLATWGLDAPMVVAHDVGGAVALRAHLLHGARFERLALVDVVALAPWGSPFFRLVHDHAGVFTRLPSNLHAALVREYIVGASHRGLAPEVLQELVDPWLGADGQPAFYRQIAQANQRDTDEIEPRYPGIDIPVLVAWGVEDAWIPIERGRTLAARIPGAQLVSLDGAGHLAQMDAPEPLLRALVGFLEEGPA